ncbi:MAG: DEAD/DEAH box helicase [Lewinellaceae bacterium]|nr:DEAD/DEAH box helicase [Lewinellaceae bacterium]
MQLHNFEQSFSSKILSRGSDYYRSGRVQFLEKVATAQGEEWYALIEGSDEEYEVEIHLTPEGRISNYDCNCPYDWGGPCKHVAAVLFRVREEKGPAQAPVRRGRRRKTPGSTAELMEAYVHLEETAQRLLKIAAVLQEATSMTKLADLFNASGFKHGNKNLYAPELTPILDKLAREGFLNQKLKLYECPKAFADALCNRYFPTDPDFIKTITPIQQAFPPYAYWYGRNEPTRLFRDMRIALYTSNTILFQRCYWGLIQLNMPEYSQDKLIEHWIGGHFDLEKLELYPPGIRAFLLSQRLTMDFFHLAPFEGGYFQYAQKNVELLPAENRPALIHLLALSSLLRGDWQQLNAMALLLSEEDSAIVAGVRHLQEGNLSAALHSFDQAKDAARRASGNKRDVLRGFGGIFQILAQLNAQDARLYKKIRAHVKQANNQLNAYTSVYHYLDAVVSFLENNKAMAVQALQGHPAIALHRFFHLLCQFWVSESLVDRKDVRAFRNVLATNGYAWIAAEMNALLGALGGITEDQPMPEGKALVYLLPRIEEWENALNVLLELGGKGASGTEVENRIAWLVDFEMGWAQARHQTHGKNGWSKGRVVSFDRLKSGDVPGMTPQDERFIKEIGHGWGSELSIYNRQSCWKQLVGHPLLFLRRSPETAVQLVEAKPTLIAKRSGQHYQLHFNYNVTTAGAKVVKESPTRYLYIEATEQMAQIAGAFNGKTLSLPASAESRLREALSGLAHLVPVQSAFEDENLPAVEADSRICLHLLPIGDGFHVELFVKPFREIPPYVKPGQGEPFLIGLLNGQRTATNRGLGNEKKNLESLRERVPVLKNNRPSSGVWQLEDAETCLQLLLELRPLLESEDIVLEWPKGEKLHLASVAGFGQFRMSIRDGSQWFEVDGELRVDEETVLSLQELLAISERESQFVELSPGKFLALSDEFRRRLKGINGLVGAQKKNGSLQLHPLAATAIEGFTSGVEGLESSQKFKERKQRLEQAFAKTFRLPKAFNATLRPYQLEGFQWLQRCADWGVGACLADDMGLGKTVQALAVLASRATLGPALVVAPASVCRNWVAETIRFAPQLEPVLFSESERETVIKNAKKGQLLIVTYDLMAREEKLFTERQWATVLLDEAQAIKNSATKRSETAMALQAGFKIAMTGTPIENHLGELWNLFQFLNPGLLGSLGQFNERFTLPIEKYGNENRREQLRRLVHPFILRRRKDEVLKELPEKTEITLTVELPPEERAFYEALRRNALEKLAETEEDAAAGQQHLRILAEIMRLRRAACHPALADANAGFTHSAKLQLFAEIVDDLLENGHKALVFSQFVDHLKILEKHLKSKKISYQYLDGSTPGKKRQEAIDAFQSGQGDLFLISLKAGGTGLNLTAADYVIHTDPWWNPAVEDQATGRAHRIGQHRPVTAYRLIAAQTIEEKILQLHAHKRGLADSLLAGADMSARLSAEELMDLLREEYSLG